MDFSPENRQKFFSKIYSGEHLQNQKFFITPFFNFLGGPQNPKNTVFWSIADIHWYILIGAHCKIVKIIQKNDRFLGPPLENFSAGVSTEKTFFRAFSSTFFMHFSVDLPWKNLSSFNLNRLWLSWSFFRILEILNVFKLVLYDRFFGRFCVSITIV